MYEFKFKDEDFDRMYSCHLFEDNRVAWLESVRIHFRQVDIHEPYLECHMFQHALCALDPEEWFDKLCYDDSISEICSMVLQTLTNCILALPPKVNVRMFVDRFSKCHPGNNICFNDTSAYHNFDHKVQAAYIIQKRWRKCISNPKYAICRKRLLSELVVLTSG